MKAKKLIVNADDLGYSKGINEGIIKAHKEGIVTSTSLMVNAHAAAHGVSLARKNPHLGVGLHFQVEDSDLMVTWQAKRLISALLLEKTKKQFFEQVEIFKQLTGRLPDHIDSHHHVHRMPRISSFIESWCKENKIPYRMQVNFIESFFGMPSIKPLSVNNLLNILRNLPEGVSELMCHPGIVTPDLKSTYAKPRELELMILTSKVIKDEVKKLKISLVNWEAPRFTFR